MLPTLSTRPWLLALGFAVLAVANPFPARAAARIEVPYTAPGKGFLSLALYDHDGVLVRSLLSAEPVAAGAGTVTWDATSDLGVPVATGEYTAKGVFFTEPPSLSWVMKVGKSGNPPWRTADGKGDWGGNLGGPAGLCANASSIVMVWGCVEDNQITGVQQMDADGAISLPTKLSIPGTSAPPRRWTPATSTSASSRSAQSCRSPSTNWASRVAASWPNCRRK